MAQQYRCIPQPGMTCPSEATYYVWFKGFGNVYTYMCPYHAAQALAEGVFGHVVSCIKLINDENLKSEDQTT